MRHGSSRRQRNNRGRKGNQNRMQVFDSNGPDVRIRGTAHQVHEKYMALAKDAQSSGDDVMYQNYLQHAEHYQRIINSWESSGAPVSSTDESPEESASENSKPRSRRQERSDDDLGLPSSIVGDAIPTAAENEESVSEPA